MLPMNWQAGLFYLFAFMTLMSAIQVVIAKNPVRSVLSLVFTFFCTAVLWLLLELEFLAIALVLVYVGAVMVLFLFVVMMLDVELATIKAGFTRHLPLASCVAVLVVVGLVYAVTPKTFSTGMAANLPQQGPHYSQVKTLGELLYTQYLYPLELAAILLLVAIISAISLTFRGTRRRKQQAPAKQVAVTKSDRLRLVKE